MSHQVIRTNQAPAPVGPYNQAIAATGQFIFVAGQIPLDPQTGNIVGGDDVAQQTEQSIANLQAILTAAGVTLQDVVKTTVFGFANSNSTRSKALRRFKSKCSITSTTAAASKPSNLWSL